MSPHTSVSFNHLYRELCACVGHLFICFARFEGALSAILRLHLANNTALDRYESVALSSAIYGSLRYKAARDTIKRLLKLQKADKHLIEFIERVFAHVGHIEEFRNKIAHDTIVAVHEEHVTDDGFWQVSDQSTTRDIRNPKIYVFNADLVADAANDLVTAATRLGQNVENALLFDGLNIEPIPWQYKPSKLKLVNLDKVRSARQRSHPPQSSPQ